MNYYLILGGGVSLFCWSLYTFRSRQLRNKKNPRYNRFEDCTPGISRRPSRGSRGLC